jgi:hypothetical protein
MLVNFTAIWSILLPFHRIYGHLVYFVVILVFFPVLVCCAKKNLATLGQAVLKLVALLQLNFFYEPTSVD